MRPDALIRTYSLRGIARGAVIHSRPKTGSKGFAPKDVQVPICANDRLLETATALDDLCQAVRDILGDIPELWGDYQVNGRVDVSLLGDNIESLEEALRKAEGRIK